jgi:hypothetical protein
MLCRYMGGIGGTAPPFLTSALDGDEWSASRPCIVTPWDRAPFPIGQEAGWAPEAMKKRKISFYF